MHVTSNTTGLFAYRARSLPCLLLLALHPTALESFVLNYHGGVPRVRANDAAIARGGTLPRTSAAAGTTKRASTFGVIGRASRCGIISMGGGAMDGGGNEHKDKEDQREGTEDSSSAADDNLVSLLFVLWCSRFTFGGRPLLFMKLKTAKAPADSCGFEICRLHNARTTSRNFLCNHNDFFFFFFLLTLYFPASGQAVVTGVDPSPPRFLPSIFLAHRVQQSHCSSNFHRVLLTHALALSASQFLHKKKSQRIYTSMHSAGLELTKLTYTRLEDNLIRHRGDRLTILLTVTTDLIMRVNVRTTTTTTCVLEKHRRTRQVRVNHSISRTHS